MTDLLFLRDAYLQTFSATVTGRHESAVTLDQTGFYFISGGQPFDTGRIGAATVTSVIKVEGEVWHTIEGEVPEVGEEVVGHIDWERRHRLMRTHTALHVMCAVIADEWGVAVTGSNMEPLTARMDFELDPTPEGFGAFVEAKVNAELAADRPITVSFLPRARAMADPALIRTKINLVPEGVEEIRVVDIEGLDRQADGGTHVRSTGEVGSIRVVKTESKGKGNKRVRIEVLDSAGG